MFEDQHEPTTTHTNSLEKSKHLNHGFFPDRLVLT